MENPEDPPGEQQPPPPPPPPEAEPVEAAFLTPFSVPGEFRACEALGPCCLGFCQDTPAPSSTTCCMLKTEALCGTQGSLGGFGIGASGACWSPLPRDLPEIQGLVPTPKPAAWSEVWDSAFQALSLCVLGLGRQGTLLLVGTSQPPLT